MAEEVYRRMMEVQEKQTGVTDVSSLMKITTPSTQHHKACACAVLHPEPQSFF
jgi:hypothetical protein